MLRLTIFDDGWDRENDVFVRMNEVVLEMEHSLASLSKWESHFEKPFLSTENKTLEQMIWYIEAMTLTEDFPQDVFDRLSEENFKEINTYLGAKMTGTWFNDFGQTKPGGEVITAEIIYYWMVSLNIPFTCETWHLNRLLTLIRVCNLKNAPAKKMSASEIAQRNRTINDERKAKMGTTG